MSPRTDSFRLSPRRVTKSWQIALFSFLFLLGARNVSRAIDPLPVDIENASPEVKARYLETAARESQEQKLRVGRERYQARVQMRQELYKHMMAEVQSRQAELNGNNDTPASRSAFMSFLRPTAIVVGCGIAIILVIQAWRRTAMA